MTDSSPEPTPSPDLSVAEDSAMGRRQLGRFNTIDRAAMVPQVAQLVGRLGVSINPNRPARGRVHRRHHRPVQLLRTAL